MALLPRLSRSKRVEVIVECRRCGTTIQGSRAACPTCGESGFAEYRLPA